MASKLVKNVMQKHLPKILTYIFSQYFFSNNFITSSFTKITNASKHLNEQRLISLRIPNPKNSSAFCAKKIIAKKLCPIFHFIVSNHEFITHF